MIRAIECLGLMLVMLVKPKYWARRGRKSNTNKGRNVVTNDTTDCCIRVLKKEQK
jgi:hypothetical protein